MKSYTINTYSFDELSDKAKETARSWWRDGHHFDGEYTIDDAKECLKFLGFRVDKVYYSGFSSQGDGASFEGSFDASRFSQDKLKEHAPTDQRLHDSAVQIAKLIEQVPGLSFSVAHRGHYYHDGCTEFSFDWNEEADNSTIDEHEEQAMDITRSLMRWIYRQLEQAWEWELEDENVDECIRANEYEFTLDGKRSVIL